MHCAPFIEKMSSQENSNIKKKEEMINAKGKKKQIFSISGIGSGRVIGGSEEMLIVLE